MTEERKISAADQAAVREMARRYDMSVGEFARELLKESALSLHRHLRLTQEQYELVERRARERGEAKAGYCLTAILRYLDEPFLLQPIARTYQRGQIKTCRLLITYPSQDIYLQCQEAARQLGISTTNFLRRVVTSCPGTP